MLLIGIALIILAHRELPKDHRKPEKIVRLATNGIYSKIRHPVLCNVHLIRDICTVMVYCKRI
ncbi:MAG: hypothetical protein NDF53_01180 [archaeon GB-1867-097]|nr:hypothetical protein [Candidatus Culexmicrobium thermophilum]HDO21050.1 hypothetical protein [Candidatus Bathyarchaeota archaeon]